MEILQIQEYLYFTSQIYNFIKAHMLSLICAHSRIKINHGTSNWKSYIGSQSKIQAPLYHIDNVLTYARKDKEREIIRLISMGKHVLQTNHNLGNSGKSNALKATKCQWDINVRSSPMSHCSAWYVTLFWHLISSVCFDVSLSWSGEDNSLQKYMFFTTAGYVLSIKRHKFIRYESQFLLLWQKYTIASTLQCVNYFCVIPL